MTDKTPIPAKEDTVSASAMIRTLGGIALISGILVVLVYQVTLPAIQENRRIALERAIFKVLPGAVSKANFMLTEDGQIRLDESEVSSSGDTIYAGYDNSGMLIGLAMVAAAPGYADIIRILYGYSIECECIIGIKVLESKETPGLGDKIEKDPEFLKNFVALDGKLEASKMKLLNEIITVKHGTKKHPWEIDAISGATVSSKAIGKMLNNSSKNTISPYCTCNCLGETAVSSILEQDKPITLDTFMRGIWEENPVFVMLLGMCPVLAVTNSVMNALAMGLATTFVLVCSSALVSSLRHTIPKQVRIASYIIIIATFVTIVDYVIQAVSLELYKALGAFIQLIVVNCIILGRAEAYASKFPITKTIVNSLGMSVGFTIALLCLGSVRELLGSGTLLGISVFGDAFQPWAIMVLPPGGFIVLACWLLLFSWLQQRKQHIKEDAKVATAHGI